MADDNLFAILDMIRAEMPEVPDATFAKLKRLIGTAAPGVRAYIPSRRKRSHIEAIAEAGEATSAHDLAKKLGLSVRRVQQLKRLR